MIIATPFDPKNVGYAGTERNVFVIESTSVPIGHDEYSPSETYSEGDIVYFPDSISELPRLYESIENGNNNNQPDENPDKWLDLGLADPYKMFDGGTNTLTESFGEINISISTSGIVNALAFFNASAASVHIVVKDSAETETLYDQTFDNILVQSEESNWWSYFFAATSAELTEFRDFTVLNMPTLVDSKITVQIKRPSSIVKCGLMVVARQQKLGVTTYEARVGIRDYSRKEVNQFGNFSVTERRFAKTGEFDIVVPTRNAPSLQRILSSIRTKPSVWIPSARADISEENPLHEESLIYGFYRDFSINLQNENESRCTIDIEGL